MKVLAPVIPQKYFNQCKVVKLKTGLCFMCAKEEAKYVYILQQGAISLSFILEDGSECELSPFSDECVIGAMEALLELPQYTYSAKTLKETVLIRMEKSAFLAWLEEDLEASLWVNKMLAKEYHTSFTRTIVQTRYDTLHRLMKHLLLLGTGRHHLTHQQIADACAMSLRSTQRSIFKLRDMGLVSIIHGKMEVSAKQLEAIRKQLFDV